MRSNHFVRLFTLILLICSTSPSTVFAQDTTHRGFIFDTICTIRATPVKHQDNSGTCWSFAVTSFIESEIIRMGGTEINLSEMYFVRNTYADKGQHYVRMHGTSNYSAGGQAHHGINAIKKWGFLTETAYPGLNYGENKHIHGELDEASKAFLDVVVKNPNHKVSTAWRPAFEAILDAYLGTVPTTFDWNGSKLTPMEAVKASGFNPDDYVELTSYSIYPFYETCALEIPDNYDLKLYYNLPINDLMEVINYAFKKGFSVCWDGDVGNKGFSHNKGMAIVPDAETTDFTGTEKAKWEKMTGKERLKSVYSFEKPVPEKQIGQAERDTSFENQTTTDDHLMHLTGVVKDQNGTIYYITKNSWGTESNDFGGYLNMSESYFKLNTVAILVHKDAIPKHLAKKLGIK
ncbi:MAG TPA: aminopeptidase [Bacteroidales bacterium]|nr:MAG: hypothetical protein A2X11_14305 [Bacteroidetes bacterium GWE2_42_24]OFY31527.1 MAG: hypothetical protein A2X09_08040 [Bacteroidetes bacterium GWF2_43_11]HAQ65761.1 aminopeptidase [Bacteroidales bacterium]HBZ67223.1 aminopeptidase [Bacteroidales bacterium]